MFSKILAAKLSSPQDAREARFSLLVQCHQLTVYYGVIWQGRQ
jgi:hypothetical protein